MRSRTSIFSARHRTAAVAGMAAAAVLLTGCGSSAGDSGGSGGGSSASGELSELAAKLPKDILDRGYIQDLKQTPAAPFEFDDDKGKFTGIDVDLTARLSEVIDFPIKTDQITDFAQLIPSVQTKRADMVWSAALDKVERQQVVTIVDYFKTGSIFMLLKDSKVKAVTELCGKTVATNEGTNYPAQLDALSKTVCAGKDPFKVLALAGTAEVLQQQVESGRAEVIYGGSDFNAYQVQQHPDDLKLLGDIYSPGQYGILVNKDYQALADVVQEGLQMMVDDGSYQKILDKWGQGTAALAKITINGTK
ncbi:MAG: transporter substrate-binding protein [Pseudonocardiales bacterium]|nr:transporter substrate-binding protein [Pseudonocardiales bacterium]